MFAIIKTGGKQYLVHPGDKIRIEKLDTSQGSEAVFDRILIAGEEGREMVIGTPYLTDYTVKGRVLKHGKGKKIIVYKYKPKKRYDKKQGHRQFYTEVEILEISPGGAKKVAVKKTIGTKKAPKASAGKKKEASKETENKK